MLCIAIILCIIVFLAFLRFWVLVEFDEGKLGLYLGLGVFYFALDLEKPKSKKKEKKPKKAKKPSKKPETIPLEGKEKLLAILDLGGDGFSLLMDILGRLGKNLVIDKLDVRLRWGADDPCDAAIGYGKASWALSTLLTTLERVLHVKERYGGVELDYTIDKPKIYAQASCSLRLKDIVSLGVFAVGAGVKVYNSHKKIIHTLKNGKKDKTKGGAI